MAVQSRRDQIQRIIVPIVPFSLLLAFFTSLQPLLGVCLCLNYLWARTV